MKKIIIVKFSLAVECDVVKNEQGVNVWRATHPNSKLFADAETPEQASENYREAMQRIESDKVKKESQIEREAKEEAEKTEGESQEAELEEAGQGASDSDLEVGGTGGVEGEASEEDLNGEDSSVFLGGLSYNELQKLAKEKGLGSVNVKKEELLEFLNA